MRVGILALQGAFANHADAFSRLGVTTVAVKTPEHLDGLDALALPGGESTTMSMMRASTRLPAGASGAMPESGSGPSPAPPGGGPPP